MITQIFPENLQELDWEHGDFKENVQKMEEYMRYMIERIEYNGGQSSKRISLVVSDENGSEVNEAQIVAAINEGKSIINLSANRITISSDNFELTEDGHITATAGTIADWNIEDDKLSSGEYVRSYTYTASNVDSLITKIGQYVVGQYSPTIDEWDQLDINGDGVLDVSDTAVMGAIKLGTHDPITTEWVYTVSLSPSPTERQIKFTRSYRVQGGSITHTYTSYINGNGLSMKVANVDHVQTSSVFCDIVNACKDNSITGSGKYRVLYGGVTRTELDESGLRFYDSSSNLLRSYSATGALPCLKTKTVTGTTTSAGNINIGLGTNCYVLSVRQLSTADRVCIPYQGNASPTTSDCWWVHIIHDGTTYYTGAESCTLWILYYEY